jgi:CheY-like chemotaxis protein
MKCLHIQRRGETTVSRRFFDTPNHAEIALARALAEDRSAGLITTIRLVEHGIHWEMLDFDGLAASYWLSDVSADQVLSGIKVLVVEDNDLIAQSIINALDEAGLRVVGVAARAAEAITLAQRERPNVVLMDVQLAGRRTGVEAAAEIYDSLGIRSLFLSTMTDPQTRALAVSARPVGWLTKPFRMETVIQKLEQLCQSGELDPATPG